MVKLFRKSIELVSRPQTGIFSASIVIMMAVFLSRILGLVRDRMLAGRFTPDELGVYHAAFRLPNLLFELLVMGALSTAFIPVFTSFLEEGRQKEAFRMASIVINIGIFIFALSAILIFIFTRPISQFFAPGFSGSQINEMVSYTRIMLVAQVFPLILGNFFTGILQSFRNFIIPAAAPVLYNVGIILGIILFVPMVGLYGPVYGVVLGAILFVLIQLPLVIKKGYRHNLDIDINAPGVKEVGKLMVPRTIGLGVAQIDTTVDLMLSTLLGAANVTIFTFAQHLQQVPIGLFGVSLAQATLPTLSALWAKGQKNEYKRTFLNSLHQILFLIVPISAILIVLRIPAVRLVFGAERFDWIATVMTGRTVAYFSISLFAQGIVQLLARGFFALHDSKTPVLVGGFAVILNTFLSIIFITTFKMPVWSLALSTSIASITNAGVLLFLLNRRIGGFSKLDLILPAVKILLAGAATGVALYIPIKLLDQLVFDTTRTFSLLMLTSISTIIGLSVYLFLAWFLDIPQISQISHLLKRAKTIKGIFVETSQEVVDLPKSS
ncbi:murein biosynthesis integral membrane protein MurJ [Candidatus Gottesmanbacteria bacterium]|nr:murein biosynthesis integral membrane protein MurJ [Candidatus Gottesmanbacteria bacterium]